MTPHTAFDPSQLRLNLPSGASHWLALRPGAVVICAEGSVRIEEAVNGWETAGGLHRVVAVRLNAGEAHGVAYGGALRVTAIVGARVTCLDAPGRAQSLFRLVAAFFHRFLPENGNNRLGALHKISK